MKKSSFVNFVVVVLIAACAYLRIICSQSSSPNLENPLKQTLQQKAIREVEAEHIIGLDFIIKTQIYVDIQAVVTPTG